MDIGRTFSLLFVAFFLGWTADSAHSHGVIGPGGKLQTDAPKEKQESDRVVPAAVQGSARVRARSVVNLLKVWEVGQTLKICFLNGSPEDRRHVAIVASEWTKSTDLKFDFGAIDNPQTCHSDGTENIKITFRGGTDSDTGYWSYVGKDSNKYSPSMMLQDLDIHPAMVNESTFEALVLHEFGHALGLEHEHQGPTAGCGKEINWTAAENYYLTHDGWDKKTVHDNLEPLVDGPRYRTTAFDAHSIMLYALAREIFRTDIPQPPSCFIPQPNTTLSELDRKEIALTYPTTRAARDLRNGRLANDLDAIMKAAHVPDQDRRATFNSIMSNYSIQTFGPCSPVVTNASGDVTVNIGGDANCSQTLPQ